MKGGKIYCEKSMSTREIPRAEPKGFPEGLGYISKYILTQAIIQTFSISKSYTSSIVFPWSAIFEELILLFELTSDDKLQILTQLSFHQFVVQNTFVINYFVVEPL